MLRVRSSMLTTLKLEARPGRRRFEIVPAVEMTRPWTPLSTSWMACRWSWPQRMSSVPAEAKSWRACSVLARPWRPEGSEAPGDRASGDAVGRVDASYDGPPHLQGRAQVLGDVPLVPGVLELVGLLAEEAAHVAGHGPEPADVVVAGDDDAGCLLLDPVQVLARLRELLPGAPLREIPGDRDRVRRELDDKLS